MDNIKRVFDLLAAQKRCLGYRRRILEISQKLSALHIAPAFSCLEMVDLIYFGLMDRGLKVKEADTFILSKGHGSVAQYVILEKLGIIPHEEVEKMCRAGGYLGTHPDYGIPGIEASTGSLGHGIALAAGMALADQVEGKDRIIYVMMSDGELQEGSVWEILMLAPTLELNNLVVFVDLNDFQTLGRTSEYHPNFYPVLDKVSSFGWEAVEVDGHDARAVYEAVTTRKGKSPFFVIGHTIKGKGVSYMENVPIWHYRSPSPEEYQLALSELGKLEL